MNFREIALLLLPLDHEGVVVEATEAWDPNQLRGVAAPTVIWGTAPRSVGRSIREVLWYATARELGLLRVRRSPPGPYGRIRIHRWPLPRVRPGRLRNLAKRALYDGAVVELSRQPADRVIDACARAAGDHDPALVLRPASAELLMARGRPTRGAPYVLRATRTGAPADPYPTGDILERLREAGCSPVPRLLGRGRVAGASWVAESLRPGRRPQRLPTALAAAVARFCATLPPAEGPPASHRRDFEALAGRFPDRSEAIRKVSEDVDGIVRRLPGVFRHGDLWVGNLLARRGRLTGIVDWDAGHPEGVPGVDLLHLHAVERLMARGREIGEAWQTRPWTSKEYAALCEPQWQALGIRPSSEELEAIGLAWWASRVPEMILTEPVESLAPGWVERNVEAVLDRALA